MQVGPVLGAIAVLITAATTDLWLLGGTRWLEGMAAAASIPSILGYIAVVTSGDEGLRGKAVARFEAATIAGLGVGAVVAGPLFEVLGPGAFVVNAVIYGVSFAIYRFGVRPVGADAAASAAAAERPISSGEVRPRGSDSRTTCASSRRAGCGCWRRPGSRSMPSSARGRPRASFSSCARTPIPASTTSC